MADDPRARLSAAMMETDLEREARQVLAELDREGIQYTGPRSYQQQAYGGRLGESAGPAPTAFDRVRGYAGQVVNMAAEATGLPSAARAGEALAEGNLPRAAGNALLALPSRVGAILGAPLASAEAQQPDPRLKTIKELDAKIAANKAKLEKMATTNYRSTVARQAATKPYEDENASLQARRDTLQGQMDEEFRTANDARLAAERGAAWAKTPFQKRYPGALEGGVAATAAVGGAVPFFATRGRVRHHVAQVQALDDQILAAVNRANDGRLAPRNRTQAANDARALLAQRDQLVQQSTGDHGIRGHLGAAAGGGALTELPMAGALAHDYLAGRADPSGELYDKTLESVNIVEHPGQVLGRYAIPFGLGAAAGGAGHYLGSQGGNVPAGHAGAVNALKRQYRAPRRR